LKKIKSGVYGLNPLMDGGINEGSSTVVIGASGAGKTTLALQYIMRGMEVGDDGVFISLDENQDQIIQEAVEMGWSSIHKYLRSEKLVFIDASGEQFSTFIRQELPNFVADWRGIKSRIVIDPLTPVMWAVRDRYEQRELLSFLFKEMRKLGTVLMTLEEHGPMGDLSGDETVIPMYLADGIIHLKYTSVGGSVKRNLKIVKCRSSKHSEISHPYRILPGVGLVVQRPRQESKSTRKVPEKLSVLLDKRMNVIPATVRKRVNHGLDILNDEDFENMDLQQLMSDIVHEYDDLV